MYRQLNSLDRYRWLLLAMLAVLAGCAADERIPSGKAVESAAFDVLHDVAIPMRDGVVLRADIYKPAGDGPFPVLLYRTPYNKADAASFVITFLAVLLFDVEVGIVVGIAAALLLFIYRTSTPHVAVVGHIHEGRGIDRVGDTIVANGGALRDGGYLVVTDDARGLHVELRNFRSAV